MTTPPNPPEAPPRRLARALPGLAVAAILGCVADREAAPRGGTQSWSGLAIVAAGLALAVASIRPRSGRIAGGLSLLAAASLGASWHHHRWSDLPPDDLARRDWGEGSPAALRGEVAEVPVIYNSSGDGRAYTQAILDVRSIRDGLSWVPATGRLVASVAGDASAQLVMGHPVDLVGQITPIPGPTNPGQDDDRIRWRSRGIRLSLAIDFPGNIRPDPEASPSPWRSRLGRARARSQELLLERMPYEAAGLAVALLLGRREDVDSSIQEDFTRTGTLHVLAISGLHFQALALASWIALRSLRLRPLAASALVAIGALGYTALVGPAPSIARASAMTLVGCLAVARHRPTDRANLLALAALAVIALDPTAPFQAGCQLSFVGVAAIFWGVPAALRWTTSPLTPLDRVERRYEALHRAAIRRGSRRIADALLASLVAWLATLPLTLRWFHLVAPIGILLNLPLIPLTSLALLFAGATLAASWVWEPLAAPPAWACGKLLEWSTAIVSWGAGRPWGAGYLPSPPWWWALGMLGAFALAWAARGRRRGIAAGSLAASWGAIGAWFILTPARPEHPEATFLNVGRGQAVILRDPSGRVTLYDCGRPGDSRVGRKIIAPALWEHRVRAIDRLVLSGTDPGQAGTLRDLLGRFRIDRALLASNLEPGGGALFELLEGRGIPVKTLADGMEFPWGEAGTCAVRLGNCGIIDVEAGGRTLLLTGSAGLPDLVSLTAQPDGGREAVLAPRSGARAANPDWLYGWCRPRFAIVSQDRRGAGGAPPWEREGAASLRTPEMGAITLIWAPDGLNAWGFLR